MSYTLDEVIGISRFLIFLSDKVPADVYQILLELEEEYLEKKVGEYHPSLEQIEIP